ncbi:DUF6985 domain-containing protein [Pseudoduganella umbonata]|uniref:DUF6985 domain-containing protein n=1 Tax=Pseudoduganella umbonata TaxID=864828 RepID=UPI003531709A
MSIDPKATESTLLIPPVGAVEPHPDVSEWLISQPKVLQCLPGHAVQFVFDGYDDAHKAEYHGALQNLLDLDKSALTAVEPYLTQYCNEMLDLYDGGSRPNVHLEQPSDIWHYVRFRSELHVSRRACGDDEDGIYFSLGCGCDWEPEHGLDLVLRDGLAFTKVGLYDVHLTNSDAYADRALKNVILRACASEP